MLQNRAWAVILGETVITIVAFLREFDEEAVRRDLVERQGFPDVIKVIPA